MSRDEALRLDASDPLAPLRNLFSLPQGLIYLDGNSLGALPVDSAERVRSAIVDEWGVDLISSWNTAGWMQMPGLVGDKIATLIGAGPGTVAVADSTSVNLFKVLTAAAALSGRVGSSDVIVSERENFPTDLYIAESVVAAHGLRLELIDGADVYRRLSDPAAAPVAIVMLTQINYRTGAMHDMAAVTSAAHTVGAITVWDLAHSAGAVEVDLTGAEADFAVGCGYKYLNGGPGAPAFAWVNPLHIDSVSQPLSGWMGHAAPFDFTTDYRPAEGITKFLCGTPAVLGLAALDAGVDTVLAANPFGGMAALRAKSTALTSLFIDEVDPICAEYDMIVVTPTEPNLRGSQVSLSRTADGYPIMQALIAHGVVGDFRAPDILRFGFTPLYTRFVDVVDACQHLREVLASDEWRDERFSRRGAVT
ncbi:MAG: kynureninase [Ilumatobacteraceae bacterium]